MNCPTGKKNFGSKSSAQAAADRIGRTGLDYYKCSDCGWWHQGRPWKTAKLKAKMEDSLRELSKGVQKLIEEHLDKHRKRLVEKAAQEIAEDLQKQAILAQSEIVRAWQEREAQENLKLAKALAERDLAKESTE